jgi:hypothetical protein
MLYTVFACGFPSTCTGSRHGLTQPPTPQSLSENPKIHASALEAKRKTKDRLDNNSEKWGGRSPVSENVSRKTTSLWYRFCDIDTKCITECSSI